MLVTYLSSLTEEEKECNSKKKVTQWEKGVIDEIRAKQWMKGENGLRITTSKIPACFSLYNLESVYFCSLVLVLNVTPRIDFRIKSKREWIEFLPKWSTISGLRKGSKVRVLIPFCARILEKFAHTCALNRISRVTNYKEKTSNPCLPSVAFL